MAAGGEFLPITVRVERSKRANAQNKKRADWAEQYSTLNSADVRIRAWEKSTSCACHQTHQDPALAAIATATQLTLEDIRNEQALRSARRARLSSDFRNWRARSLKRR